MPHINYEGKEIVFKIVYFGPGMSGKTTNLIYIHRMLAEKLRGEMISLDTTGDRTLFFDFFPLELGDIEGFKVRFNMYTVPGQVYYEASRQLILDGADGVVFVADSEPVRLNDNIESFMGMQNNLRHYNIDWRDYPLTLQYNKRDCEKPLPLGTLEEALGLDSMPVQEAVAIDGRGVMDTIRVLSRMVIERFQL
jgi:signal recognition particle receptor subunit beta